jgi:hypothetical protein
MARLYNVGAPTVSRIVLGKSHMDLLADKAARNVSGREA